MGVSQALLDMVTSAKETSDIDFLRACSQYPSPLVRMQVIFNIHTPLSLKEKISQREDLTKQEIKLLVQSTEISEPILEQALKKHLFTAGIILGSRLDLSVEMNKKIIDEGIKHSQHGVLKAFVRARIDATKNEKETTLLSYMYENIKHHTDIKNLIFKHIHKKAIFRNAVTLLETL